MSLKNFCCLDLGENGWAGRSKGQPGALQNHVGEGTMPWEGAQSTDRWTVRGIEVMGHGQNLISNEIMSVSLKGYIGDI